jgi:AraC family transcriptional regulator, transcriptional activator of pobA
MIARHAARRRVPSFSLYGDSDVASYADSLHIEDIPSRSRKYLWRIGAHRHRSLSQCVFVSDGEAIVDLDGSRSTVRAPAVIIIPAATVHGFRFRPETQGYVLTVTLERLLTIAAAVHRASIQSLFSAARAFELDADPELSTRTAQLLERLLIEFKLPDSSSAPVPSWLACCVLWLLAGKCAIDAPRDRQLGEDLEGLRRFRLSLESHLLDHWPITRYARELGVSETRLNGLCRRLTGDSAFNLVQERLALEARRRLLFIAGPIGRLAVELGFKDAAYFCRFFRRHHGMSPGEFRTRQGGG